VSMKISKSKFCAGVQCLKRLYLLVHEPELAAKLDAASEAIMAQGREVGLLARLLFPNGTEVDGSRGLEEVICATCELLANSEVPGKRLGKVLEASGSCADQGNGMPESAIAGARASLARSCHCRRLRKGR